MTDPVDEILEQWAVARPDLDVSPMAVIGRLSRLSRLVDQQLKRTFDEHDLDAPSFDVLATLRRSAPDFRLTPTQLMRSAMVTSGAITQRLDKLEARGLVKRGPSSTDGRGSEVSLTAAGKRAIDAALPDHLATEQRLLAGLDTTQRRDLSAALATVLASITAAAE